MDDTSFTKGREIATRIAQGWGLTPSQTDHLLADDIERISYVLGIYKALRILYPTENRANGWPARPNRAFEGRSPLDVMLEGDLAKVRRYLDGQGPDTPEEMETSTKAIRALWNNERY